MKLTYPVRLLYLIPSSFGRGGMECGIVNLINNLSPEKYAFSICSLGGGPHPLLKVLKRPVTFIELTKKDGIDLNLIIKIAKFLRREKIHVLHTRNFAGLLYGVLAAKLASTPFIVHSEHGRVSKGRASARRFIQKRLVHHIDKYFTVSYSLSNTVISEGISPSKVVVIPNGVDTNRFIPSSGCALKNELGINNGEVIIGTVGRLESVKDHKTLLLAAKQLLEKFPRILFLIVGDGPLRQKLESLSEKLGVQRNVIFLGVRDDVEKVLSIMDVFVLPSLMEGLPNALLEAMSCGKVVIATNVGGNKEVVGKFGILIPPQAPDILSGAIENLLGTGLDHELGKLARERTIEKFSLANMIERYDCFYTSIIEGKSTYR